MDNPIDKFQFEMEQRRKFLKEFSAFAGFTMVSGVELCRSAPTSITREQDNDDGKWGTISGRITYDGAIPERTKVDLEKVELSPQDLKWFKSADPILTEDWVVNPANRGVQWVFVWLVPETANTRATRDQILPIHDKLKNVPAGQFVTVDQNPQGYVPHAVAMREGMGLKMRNIGNVAHVLHLEGFKNKGFTKAMPPGANQDVVGLKAENNIKIDCPPHPWERMFLKVFSHPYYAVTDKDGRFEIKNAPVGKCRIIVWQEKLGFSGDRRKGKYGQVVEVKGAHNTDLGSIKITKRPPRKKRKK